MNILNRILAAKRAEIHESACKRSFEDIHREALSSVMEIRSLSEALKKSGTGIIAEFKRRSPSEGSLHDGADAGTIVKGYALAGAAAISVLTDRDHFGGSLEDLVSARTVAGDVPLLRKDFIIDPRQICEARIAGADAILLIASALAGEQCAELASFAHSLGLEVLLEIHDANEIGHIGPHVNVVGVNNRNLATFITDTSVSKELSAHVPDGMVKISESGIFAPDTVRELRRAGYRGFLIGGHFMKQPDPARALKQFIETL